jgi:hypothetical protein
MPARSTTTWSAGAGKGWSTGRDGRRKRWTAPRLADDEPYRREGKAQANLVEGRHDLARRIYHGKKGEMVRTYYEGMEDQLSSLGLVLNCAVLWNTVYSNRAVEHLRAQGYPVLETDEARLSAFIRGHVGIDGHYAFHQPDLGGSHRPLRDPDSRTGAALAGCEWVT